MKRTAILLLAAVLLFFCGAASAEEAPRFVTIDEWLEAKGECGDFLMAVQIREIINPVLAVAGDETGSVNMFSSDGGIIEFNFLEKEDDPDFYKNYLLVISNPRYNEFEGTIEMAGWKLLRCMLPVRP